MHDLAGKCKNPSVPQGRLCKIRNASLSVHGAKLFNALPKHVRNVSGVPINTFKSVLDNFLRGVQDEPQLVGYTAQRRAS